MTDPVPMRQGLSTEAFDRSRIAAPAHPRRPIVMLMGMHRSGTSLCSHILSALGVDMADDIGARRGNDNGHWERWELMDFHDRILARFNRTYLQPLHDLPLPAAWWADPAVASIRKEIEDFVEPRMARGLFGFKDPRTVRLMPLWHQICEDLKLAPKIILSVRNPAQVARSLEARDGLDRAIGEYRWLVHMMDFFRYIGNHEFCLVKYEDWFEDPRINATKLQKFLGLQWHQSDADLDFMLAELIKPQLRHDEGERQANLRMVRHFYQVVQQPDANPNAREALKAMVSLFADVQQLQRPLQWTLEEVYAQSMKLPQTEQQIADLRTLLGEQEEKLRLADADMQNGSLTVQLAKEETEGLRALLGEREAVLTAEAEAQRGHLADIEAQLTGLRATIEQEREDAARLSQGVMAENANLQAALSEQGERLRTADVDVRNGLLALQHATNESEALKAALAGREAILTAEADGLRRHLAEIEAQLAGLRTAIEQNREEAARLLLEARAERANLQATLHEQEEKLRSAGAAMQNGLIALPGAMDEAEAMSVMLAEREAPLTAEADGLRRHLTEIEGQLAGLRSTIEQNRQEAARLLQGSLAENANLRTVLDERDGAMTRVMSDLDTHQKALEKSHAEADDLRRILSEGNQQLAVTKEHAAANEARLAQALQEMDGLRSHLTELEQQHDDRTRNLQSMEESAAALRTSLVRREEEVIALHEQVAMARRVGRKLIEAQRMDEIAHQEALRNLDVEAEELRKMLGESDEALAVAKDQAVEYQETVQNLGREADALRSTLSESDDALAFARDQVAAGEAQLARALFEIESGRAQLAEVEGERNSRVRDLNRTEECASALRASLARREAEIVSLHEQVAVARRVSRKLVETLRNDRVAPTPSQPIRDNWWQVLRSRMGITSKQPGR